MVFITQFMNHSIELDSFFLIKLSFTPAYWVIVHAEPGLTAKMDTRLLFLKSVIGTHFEYVIIDYIFVGNDA